MNAVDCWEMSRLNQEKKDENHSLSLQEYNQHFSPFFFVFRKEQNVKGKDVLSPHFSLFHQNKSQNILFFQKGFIDFDHFFNIPYNAVRSEILSHQSEEQPQFVRRIFSSFILWSNFDGLDDHSYKCPWKSHLHNVEQMIRNVIWTKTCMNHCYPKWHWNVEQWL